ncbi:MAG TPA: NAD(P)-dependent oxidoreductase [Acidimicrobiales bacterium]|nr:NAD(P)-dependent oxidoreductase [Acidimicrobiales bacterium]
MADRTALVTGSTGYLGSRLVPALVQAGWAVRASGRRDRPDTLPDEVGYRPAELAGDDDLGPLIDGVTHVFHLAGASSSRSDEEEMQRTNVVGTRNLVAAARRAGAERFVHMSTTAVYGEEEQLPLPVVEDVEPHPSRAYGKAKLGAESEVWAARDELPVVVLRPVSVYGPGAVKLVASAVLDVAIERYAGLDAIAVHREPIEQRLLHVDDLVAATIHLAGHDGAVGRAFNVVSGQYPSSLEVAEALADEFDMKVQPVDDPECGLSYEERGEVRERMLAEGMTDDIYFTEQRFRFMRKGNRNNRLSIDALLGTGFELRQPDTRDGIADAVAWYREHRWIV